MEQTKAKSQSDLQCSYPICFALQEGNLITVTVSLGLGIYTTKYKSKISNIVQCIMFVS